MVVIAFRAIANGVYDDLEIKFDLLSKHRIKGEWKTSRFGVIPLF